MGADYLGAVLFRSSDRKPKAGALNGAMYGCHPLDQKSEVRDQIGIKLATF